MPVDSSALISALEMIARERNVSVHFKKSAQAGIIAGGICFLGALVAGTTGLIFGGLAGTALAYKKSEGLKPLWQIINEDLNEKQKTELALHVQEAFRDLNAQDFLMLSTLLLSNINLQERAMQIALNFISSQCIGN